MSRLSVWIHKRIIAGILGILMLFIMIFSTFYIAIEIDHDCSGEDCPICICNQQCENTLRQIGNGIAIQIAIVVPIFSLLISVFLFTFDFPQETLVSRKVRLNN